MLIEKPRLISIILLILISCGLNTASPKEMMMNKKTTLCFGRFLIDLPEGLQVKEIGQQSKLMFDEIKSRHIDGGIDAFTNIMHQREGELRTGKQKDQYKLIETIWPSNDSRIFVVSRQFDLFPKDPPSVGIEFYRWDNGNVFSLERTGLGPGISNIIERLRYQIAPNIRNRRLDEIPSEPGICIKDGFIADDGDRYQFEEARIQINFKEWPDVWVSVLSQTVPKAGDESLLTRIDKHPETALEKAYIKTFRRGKREVNGFRGEELLDLLPTEDGIKQHYFHWEALGEVKNIFAPLLDLEFETAVQPLKGPRPRPSLTDDQAIKLYDTIVSSIRLRPTIAPVKSSADEPPKKPLGERAVTGRTCPQTGWWQSEDEGVVAEWRRLHFKEGDVFPMGRRRRQPNLWQKVKGEQSVEKFSTVWRLVEYGEAPQNAAEAAPKQASASPDTDAKDAGPPNLG